MKKWAVAYVSFFENDVKVKIVEDDGDWRDAFESAFPGHKEYFADMDDIEEAKKMAADAEFGLDVKQID